MAPEDWLTVVNVHLNGSFFVSRAAAEPFRAQGEGAFIHMTSRMTSSIPAETPEQKARVAKLEQITPDKNALLVVFLASDAARDVTGQVFATRHNEIFLMSQSRPLRSVHRGEGWTPALVAEHALPALRQSLLPLDRSPDVFGWHPV